MCLGIPMKIRKIEGEFAEVESGRLIRKANMMMLPQARIGDYVIVHAGFAIEKVDPQRARETLRLIDEIH
jgi:hydrogenase expression/formation protein HypC